MPLHSTDAIVIGGHDLGEADRIIVFYTEAQGKVRAVAQGARRLRSKFGGSLQLFSRGRLVYWARPNKTLHSINEFGVIRGHQPLLEDLDRIALGSAAVEVVALGVEEEEAFPELYELLAAGLELLETSARPAFVFHGFALQALRLLGYRPELGQCVRCHRIPRGGPLSVTPQHGGLVCDGCRPGVVDALAVSPEVLGFLRGASTAPLRVLDRVTLSSHGLDQAGHLLQAFIQAALGRPLRSTQFLGNLPGR